MKYIYGLKKSGLSLISYLNSINEEYYCWDDDETTREKLIKFNFKNNLINPNNLDAKLVDEAFITPGISLQDKKIDILKKIGAKIKLKNNQITIQGNKKIKNTNISTAPYPGFPTDLQAQMMVLLCKANKKSIIREKIFENRFMHVAELNRMGAKIKINGNKAIIEGNIKFEGAELMATDLRASVSLILAALISKGKSRINRIYHLDRGYERIETKLKKIGARIKRVA